MTEDNINGEFYVVVNGPSLGHWSKAIEQGMDEY